MGQTKDGGLPASGFRLPDVAIDGAFAGAGMPRVMSPDGLFRYFVGSDLNFSTQPAQQK
jgi:hypothetical protein